MSGRHGDIPQMIAEAVYVPKHLDLPQAEIDRLEREKAELLAGLKEKIPVTTPRPDPLGEGAPVGIEYTVSGMLTETEPPLKPSLTGRITADGRHLAGLMSKAKKLEAAAERLGEKANAARQAAYTARLELNNYMTQHGLA